MPVSTVKEPKKAEQKIIQPNTLLEHLYTNYSLSQLQTMLNGEPDKLLMQKWKISRDTLRNDLITAIDFVKND